MTHYRHRPPGDVEAVQWSGSNWHQMLAFAGKTVVSTDGKALFLKGKDGSSVVPEGWWVVRDREDRFLPYDPDAFRDTFEEIP